MEDIFTQYVISAHTTDIDKDTHQIEYKREKIHKNVHSFWMKKMNEKWMWEHFSQAYKVSFLEINQN